MRCSCMIIARTHARTHMQTLINTFEYLWVKICLNLPIRTLVVRS